MSKRFVLATIATLAGSACSDDSEVGPAVIRLQDAFTEATLTGTPDTSAELPRTEWTFESEDAIWQVGSGVEDLRVEDGRLIGTSTSDFPVVYVERTDSVVDDGDLLHAVEIRARVSAGTDLQMTVRADAEPNFGNLIRAARIIPWGLTTPLVPGDDFQTYTLSTVGAAIGGRFDLSSGGIRSVLIRPTTEAGAEFEIESVRLIFREEYLATIDSGISWQGFGHVFRETLVSRAPESVRFATEVPENPWLDVAVATVEEMPVTFRVAARQGETTETIFERTLTTADRWEPLAIDLSAFAGQAVDLELSLASEKEGALGFWGAPAIRSRGVSPPGAADAPQAVIVFLADTLRRDHLDEYGYERDTAPVLTRLAGEGVLFEDNVSQAPWTRPSVASILSSLPPSTHGIKDTVGRIAASVTTLAEVYREAGYETVGMVSNGFIGRGSNLHQGFEEFHESGSIDRPPEQSGSKTARLYVDKFVPWLKAHRDVPFFAYVHVTDPHSRYDPYRPYDTLYGPADGRARQDEREAALEEAMGEPIRLVTGRPLREDFAAAGVDADAFVQQEIDWYDGSIRAMDVELGRIVETLDELGMREKTLLVFMADHGDEFLDHGGHWHDNVYGENANVPLVMWSPGRLPSGQRITETVRSIDVMPTLLDISGLTVPERAQGQSLLPLMVSSEPEAGSGVANAQSGWRPQPAFTEFAQFRVEDIETYAIIDGGWKLVHNEQEPAGAPEWQLFDHVNDPLDQNDVASEHPDVVERLQRLLSDWHEFAVSQQPSDAEVLEEMSSEELERLRGLGYL
jgi:arylsulfatase A-like enzyme